MVVVVHVVVLWLCVVSCWFVLCSVVVEWWCRVVSSVSMLVALSCSVVLVWVALCCCLLWCGVCVVLCCGVLCYDVCVVL